LILGYEGLRWTLKGSSITCSIVRLLQG